MNFFLKPPSLEQRALVKTAVSLWNQNDVGALIPLARVRNLKCFYPRDLEWKAIEARVLERVPQLSLPPLLNEKLSCLIQSVGLQIFEWIHFHCICYDLLPLSPPLELCWTPQGTVDRKKTAEVLVRDESLDLSTCYQLACLYCLEEDIIALWNRMPEDLKQSFLCEDTPNIRQWHEKWIIGSWSRTMERRGLGHAHSSHIYGFKKCVYQGNKAAAEYFLQKLTPREREEFLVETAKDVMIEADTLCLLLAQIDAEQQMEVFKYNPRRVLRCFLQWPWQSFFMEIANGMWDYLPKKDYECLLRDIIHKVRDGYKDWDYPKLLRDFWQKSPHALKSWIANDSDESRLLPDLCGIKHKEMIQFILQDATPSAREKLIYSYPMHRFCQECIHKDEWDSLEFCIQVFFPSKNEMLTFKEVFEYRSKWKSVEDKLVENKDQWDKLFLSSEDSFHECEKRSDDEGENSSSKRFRSLQ